MLSPADIGAFATAGGVLVAAWQLRRSGLQAKIDFEDELNREYRNLLRDIPPDAQLGRELHAEAFTAAYGDLLRYFDLSNERVFLRMNGRISRITCADWNEGIRSTLSKPAFAKAWSELAKSSKSFSELRRLRETDFHEDPYQWVPCPRRIRRWIRQ